MRFHEVCIQAVDPERLAAWYRDQLGLPAATGGAVGVVAGATTLRFTRAAGGVEPRYHLAFNVPEDRIEDALRWARERAPIVESAGSPVVAYPAWDAHAVYFLDPAGNVLELIARHELPNASARPFDARALLEVSEVGLPSPSVPALAAQLTRALGVPAYRPADERFAPLGDAHGLLILVPHDRAWFPTEVPSRPFPLRIVHDGAVHQVPGLPYAFARAEAR